MKIFKHKLTPFSKKCTGQFGEKFAPSCMHFFPFTFNLQCCIQKKLLVMLIHQHVYLNSKSAKVE